MNPESNHGLYDYFVGLGIPDTTAAYLNFGTLFMAMLLIAFLVDFVLWRILRVVSTRMARSTRTNFDDILITNRVPRKLAHIVPLLLIYELLPWVFTDFEYAQTISTKTVLIVAVILVIRISKSLLLSIKDYLKTLPRFKDKPVDSFIQVFMIFAWLAGIMTIFAIITDTTIWKFLTALGAASAVVLLIFKDTILGLVASIQVSANDMVRIGDWISFDKYGADGDVIEINLATVKVQNWDKTITTIPTYALIADSFKNWRGMQESGGRRIKRALILKQESVHFLNESEIENLKEIDLIKNYLIDRSEKINKYNEEQNANKSLMINGRNMTNLGVFRKYVETYLENHTAVNKEMTMMTRQLAPTPQGIPLEIYVFSKDKRWQNYEFIMADIFDHLISAVPYFGLEIFELPSSLGFSKAGNTT
ncbi:mechanosensitive ion channel family protein [Lentiprolixibacter aurantiacus]|uniref:Mechanosensing system component YbdG n=1 Tax=Lentiprolixibacter aurantiacus TaxID=2993939 RepID=A0AAE3MKU9_9FLAO|nr:mechanosensitive ion channel domain-containing protein [Lentiprolixibacter aurantiacus]MCX2719615.1 mechanosensitive ion channel [Lentiprolixibacter aurantiacus]